MEAVHCAYSDLFSSSHSSCGIDQIKGHSFTVGAGHAIELTLSDASVSTCVVGVETNVDPSQTPKWRARRRSLAFRHTEAMLPQLLQREVRHAGHSNASTEWARHQGHSEAIRREGGANMMHPHLARKIVLLEMYLLEMYLFENRNSEPGIHRYHKATHW